MKWKLAAVAAMGVAALTGCSQAADPANMHTRCVGKDKLFILDDPNRGSSLFVVPDHPECQDGGSIQVSK